MFYCKSCILKNLPSLAVIAGLLMVRGLGGLQGVELGVFDVLMRWRPAESIDDRVVIVGITEQDLQQLKTYPVSDQVLAETIQAVGRLQPAAIGVDIFRSFAVPPGVPLLTQVMKTTPNLFMVYRYTTDNTGTAISAPSVLPAAQQGFVDVPIDPDGHVRRLILGFEDEQGEAQLSLPIQLSTAWLGQNAPQAVMPELPFLTPNFVAYHQLDHGGDQIMFNPRNHAQAFRRFSLQDVRSGQLRPADIQGKIVLIGITAISIKDVVNSQMFPNSQNAQVNGVEVQAHAASQLISATRDRRPLIRDWPEVGEIVWIVVWGGMGLLVGHVGKNVMQMLGGLGLGLGAIVGLSYGLLVMGWWVPLLPGLLGFGLNVAGFIVAQVYQQERDLRLRLRDRQQVLEETFTAVHNGPLQDLVGLTRQIQDTGELAVVARQLQKINQDLRQIFTAIQAEIVSDRPNFAIGVQSDLDLTQPLHELLQQVYHEICANELTGLGAIKVKVIQFDPLPEGDLDLGQKRSLCRFLEEALRNVGKHAEGATKLWVNCGCEGNRRVIVVKDNGAGSVGQRSGEGTKQAKRIAKQLRGQFKRYPNQPQGMVCQLLW